MELRLSDGKINNRGRVVLSLGSESVGANGNASCFLFFFYPPSSALPGVSHNPPTATPAREAGFSAFEAFSMEGMEDERG